jgi:hypothetical protein
MKKLLARGAAVAGTLATLAAAHLAFAPTAALAGDSHAWGFSNLGDTCSGTCGSGNICCRIVILPAA